MTRSTKRLRVIGYVRLSDYRGKNDASTAAARQREAITAMCVARGGDLVDIVENLNVSGSDRGKRLDRPGLVNLRPDGDPTTGVRGRPIFDRVKYLIRRAALPCSLFPIRSNLEWCQATPLRSEHIRLHMET
ncbi:recombinase family protein [Aeromicrobium ginsengisoli]|nr:recombinase family protein [Aeromicrobium ginsengisoli]